MFVNRIMLAGQQARPLDRRAVDQIAARGAHHRIVDNVAGLRAHGKHTMIGTGLQIIGGDHGQAVFRHAQSRILMTFDAIHALDANAAHQYQSKHHTARHDEHMQTVLFRCGITARRMQRLESLHRPTSDETHAGEEAQYHHRDARLRGTGHDTIGIHGYGHTAGDQGERASADDYHPHQSRGPQRERQHQRSKSKQRDDAKQHSDRQIGIISRPHSPSQRTLCGLKQTQRRRRPVGG